MIIVTGGAGFIGSNIVKGLNERGREDILVVDDLKDGTKFLNLTDCEILDYLEPRLSRNPEKPVILYTDAYAPYQAMISVYDVLGSAEDTRGFKVKNISVPTQSEVQEYIQLFGFNPFEQQCGG